MLFPTSELQIIKLLYSNKGYIYTRIYMYLCVSEDVYILFSPFDANIESFIFHVAPIFIPAAGNVVWRITFHSFFRRTPAFAAQHAANLGQQVAKVLGANILIGRIKRQSMMDNNVLKFIYSVNNITNKKKKEEIKATQ